MECYLAIKRNQTGSSVEMWMDLEAVKQSELERETQISYINAYMWNLKKKIGIDDFTCKTETQMKKTDVWVSRGKGE